MKFTIITAEQRSPEWYAARAGRLTGSRACDMLAKIKTGEAAARRDLRLQLVCERLTSLPQEDGYVSKDMQRGIDMEPVAFAEYEAETGLIVRRSGFIQADDLMAGCSLDGDVDGMKGIVELKCPKSATHLKYLRSGQAAPEHLPQITHNLWITGAQWCDFVSYDDRFPLHLQLFRVRVYRKDVDIDAYAAAALIFLEEVERETESVRSMKRAA